jgi:hypothetical protein
MDHGELQLGRCKNKDTATCLQRTVTGASALKYVEKTWDEKGKTEHVIRRQTKKLRLQNAFQK